MHALIRNDTIVHVGTLPRIWWDGDRWHDLRDDDGTQAAALGWLPVTDTPRPDDTDTGTHEHSIELIDGIPTVVWTPRDWTEQEQHDRAEAAAIADLDARLRAVEAHLWPPAAPDAPADDAPTWAELVPPHHWPNGTLLRDGGTVWRNVSGGVLTTPPSGFPAPTSAWNRLFVEHSTSTEPEPDPGAQPWVEGVAYSVGALVTHAGRTWRCKLAHTSHSGWAPSDATHTVWEPVP